MLNRLVSVYSPEVPADHQARALRFVMELFKIQFTTLLFVVTTSTGSLSLSVEQNRFFVGQ
jgi:hypothetical protein